MTHFHKASTEKTRAFAGTAPGARENQRAHGNITVIETCECGRVRHTNRNQGHVERGMWFKPRGAGRPAESDDGETRALSIKIRVSGAERDRIRARARAAGLEVSEYLRGLGLGEGA